MTPAAIIQKAAKDGAMLSLGSTGKVKISGSPEAVNRWRPIVREHKRDLLAELSLACTQHKRFTFELPLGDTEAIEERAAIISESSCMTSAEALQEARWQAEREQCWRRFLQHAQVILGAPKAAQAALLREYEAFAAAAFGRTTASGMAVTMRRWVAVSGDIRIAP
jgi:hypothetical protein